MVWLLLLHLMVKVANFSIVHYLLFQTALCELFVLGWPMLTPSALLLLDGLAEFLLPRGEASL